MKTIKVSYNGSSCDICVDENVYKAIYTQGAQKATQRIVSEAMARAEMMFGQDYIDIRDLKEIAEKVNEDCE